MRDGPLRDWFYYTLFSLMPEEIDVDRQCYLYFRWLSAKSPDVMVAGMLAL
jgi:hypothetical protein